MPAEEEAEVFEVTINGKLYYTSNETDGEIYEVLPDGDVGIGKFVEIKMTIQ